jgi:hypothetical protein
MMTNSHLAELRSLLRIPPSINKEFPSYLHCLQRHTPPYFPVLHREPQHIHPHTHYHSPMLITGPITVGSILQTSVILSDRCHLHSSTVALQSQSYISARIQNVLARARPTRNGPNILRNPTPLGRCSGLGSLRHGVGSSVDGW